MSVDVYHIAAAQGIREKFAERAIRSGKYDLAISHLVQAENLRVMLHARFDEAAASLDAVVSSAHTSTPPSGEES